MYKFWPILSLTASWFWGQICLYEFRQHSYIFNSAWACWSPIDPWSKLFVRTDNLYGWTVQKLKITVYQVYCFRISSKCYLTIVGSKEGCRPLILCALWPNVSCFGLVQGLQLLTTLLDFLYSGTLSVFVNILLKAC